jgi:tetratricopeptide (TPR) repeat protein
MTPPISKKRSLLSILLILSLSLSAIAADSLPNDDDVNQLARQSKQTSDDFFSRTFEIRMRYEYFGRFNDPCDKDRLRNLARTAADDLDRIANDQLTLKQSIESYQKDDWETRFGQTGLWRRLAADLLKTTLTRLEVQYYLALGFDQPSQTDILHQILTQLDTLQNLGRSPYWHLLKAKTLALLATTDPTYQPLAKKQLDTVLAQTDVPCPAKFRAELEMIKLWHGLPAREDTAKMAVPPALSELPDQIAQADCKSDREIILTLACLQHRFGPQSLSKTAVLFPLIKDDLGRLVLDDLQSRYKQDGFADVNSLPVTAFEAELAAQFAWQNHFDNSADVIGKMTTADKFRTPRFLFIAAMSVVDASPAEAVRFLIDASRLGQNAKDSDVNAGEIAKQATLLAHKLHTETANHCPLVCEAFENYLSIADPNRDPNFSNIEYLYVSVLDSCGKETQVRQLLEKICSTPGQYQNRAKLDLITQQLQHAGTETEKHTLLPQLADLISNVPAVGSKNIALRDEAITLYCQMLLDDANSQSAQKVLDMLDAIGAGQGYAPYKARALQQLGRLEKSARLMSQAIEINSGSMAPAADGLVCEITDKIELWQQDANDFNQMLLDCNALAEFAHKILNTRQTALILAEISILRGKRGQAPFSPFSPTDENDISWLRPKARLLMAQDDFNQASLLWAKIAELRRNDLSIQNQKSYNWWQAKFYELYCLAGASQADKQNIRHTIEVLQNSYPDIPRPWAQKLDSLKQQCGKGAN